MEVAEARKTGSRIAVKTWVFAILVIELIFLVRYTQHDFANGILFFIHEQANLYIATLIGGLCLAAFLLGGIAGKVILVKRWNYLLVAGIYTIFTIVLMPLYLIIAITIRLVVNSLGGDAVWNPIVIEYPITSFLIIAIYIVLVWLLVAWQIERKAVTAKQ